MIESIHKKYAICEGGWRMNRMLAIVSGLFALILILLPPDTVYPIVRHLAIAGNAFNCGMFFEKALLDYKGAGK